MKITYFKQFSVFILLTSFMFLFTNCSTNENANAEKDSFFQIISKNSNLSILKAAIIKTDLESTLDSEADYTLFAPNNSAFTSFLNANGFATINDVPTPLLKQILLNHVIAIRYTTLNLPINGYTKSLAIGDASQTNNLSLYIRKFGSDISINGIADIVSPNLLASNGIMHIVDGVIGLPTITTHTIANPNLSSFTAALNYNSSSNFINNLSGSLNAPFTVFAPTNGAFTAFFVEKNFAQLSDIPANVLEKTLKYHIIYAHNTLASEFTNNQIIATSSGENLTVVFSNGTIKIKDVNNRSAVILTTDVQCTNGIIHVIDKVVFPSF